MAPRNTQGAGADEPVVDFEETNPIMPVPEDNNLADSDFSNNPLFRKIRTQTNSQLENQKQAAVLLRAVEETILEQNEPLAPLAYFGALMTILEQQKGVVSGDSRVTVVVAATYLLAVVFPRISPVILRRKFQDIAKCLGSTIEIHQKEAPLVRSILTCLEFLLSAQDAVTWSHDAICKQLLNTLLALSVDPRPKVRKRALDASRRLLSRPPPPTLSHPGIKATLEFCIKLVEFSSQSSGQLQQQQRREREQHMLRVLNLIQCVMPAAVGAKGNNADATRAKLRDLVAALLKLPVKSSGTGDMRLTKSVFAVLGSFFGSGKTSLAAATAMDDTMSVFDDQRTEVPDDMQTVANFSGGDPGIDADYVTKALNAAEALNGDITPADMELMRSVLASILNLRPAQNDIVLLPAWCRLIAQGLVFYARSVEIACERAAQLNTFMMENNDDDEDATGGDVSGGMGGGSGVAGDLLQRQALHRHRDEYVPVLMSHLFSKTYTALLGGSNASPRASVIVEKASDMYATVLRHCLSSSTIEKAATFAGKSTGNAMDEDDNVEKGTDPLVDIIKLVNDSLVNLRFRDAWGGILKIAESLFDVLGSSAPSLVRVTLTRVVTFRDDDAYAAVFPFKPQLEAALHAAVRGMGLQTFCGLVPLNIEGNEEPKRPYLLALFVPAIGGSTSSSTVTRGTGQKGLKDVFGPHTLAYYATALVPLASRCFSRSAALSGQGRALEAKLYETLATQVWELLPGICASLPKDVGNTNTTSKGKKTNNSGFVALAPYLGKILQHPTGKPFVVENDETAIAPASFPDLRPIVCTAVQTLVNGFCDLAGLEDSTSNISSMDDYDVEVQAVVQSAILTLRSYTSRFLSTLCNNYTGTNPEWVEEVMSTSSAKQPGIGGKGQALQLIHERETKHCQGAIGAFLRIAEGEATKSYFFNLVKTLLQTQTQQQNMAESDDPSASTTILLQQLRTYAILDLLLILLPFLPDAKKIGAGDTENEVDILSDSSPIHLLYKVLAGQLRDQDVTIQKRTYKALNKVLVILLPKISKPAAPSISSLLSPGQSQQQQHPALPLLQDLVQRLLDPGVLGVTASGAKKPRMDLFATLVNSIPLSTASFAQVPSSSLDEELENPFPAEELLLQFLPVALPEVMLATKEASERARVAAFECLVAMARKMCEGQAMYGGNGGKSGLPLMASSGDDEEDEGMEDDENDDAQDDPRRKVNFREFLMMVLAGLAGSTSNMQSATIACLSRLLFDFRDQMNEEVIQDLMTTVMYLVSSPQREVVKAALGFVKVVIVSVEPEVLEDHLEEMITAILVHSRDHRSHFKVKVRHILERLIRKFSLEAVEGFVPEEDQKLLSNIRKRRDRAKRKKAEARSGGSAVMDVDESGKGGKKGKKDAVTSSRQKAFEDALHGSESELESDDDDMDEERYLPQALRDGSSSKRASRQYTQIREDDEGDVMDFLDTRVVSRVASSTAKNARANRKQPRKPSDVQVGPDGKFIIEDSDDEATKAAAASGKADAPEEDFYTQAIKGASREDAFERLPNGTIRFLKKRKRGDEDEEMEDASDGEGPSSIASAMKARMEKKLEKERKAEEAAMSKMLGRQYKAKRARGDVKKANMPDPYAYIPLNPKIVSGGKRKAGKGAHQFKKIVKAAQSNTDVDLKSGKRKSGPSIKKANKVHKR
ncbi:hypothetical protein HK102_013466, partial [Quaeritorhiza haematococci]